MYDRLNQWTLRALRTNELNTVRSKEDKKVVPTLLARPLDLMHSRARIAEARERTGQHVPAADQQVERIGLLLSFT